MNEADDAIRLLATGGTLDKDYDPVAGELDFPGSCVTDLLRQALVSLPCVVEILMQKDSLQMTDEDRAHIVARARDAAESRLVITHGTDTMTQTAAALAADPVLQEQRKIIVLTGAMRPFRLGDSDASFNMGAALMGVQLAPPGVWLAMHGRLFPWNRAKKNRPAGRFEKI